MFICRVVALVDTGCDTSILGAHLLPKGVQVEPLTNYLLAANNNLYFIMKHDSNNKNIIYTTV